MNLTELGLKYKTDKARAFHNYTPTYEKYFESMRDDEITMLEIGAGDKWGSIKMWNKYFTKGTVYVMDKCIATNPERYAFRCNQADKAGQKAIAKEVGPFDIVIDDGSHIPDHQSTSFEAFWSSIKPGGLYFIEDINVSYEPKFFDKHIKTGSRSIIPFLDKMRDKLVTARSRVNMNNGDIEFIHYYTHMVVIGKRK